LDPFEQYDDASLNGALRAAGLFSLQEEMEEGQLGLDSVISSGGSNLSVGQRQILALGEWRLEYLPQALIAGPPSASHRARQQAPHFR
jgi:ABC-type multidrug transport system fused ATPase/permease subunit